MSGSLGSLLRFGAFGAIGYSKAAILAVISSILALFTDRLEASSVAWKLRFADTDRLEGLEAS